MCIFDKEPRNGTKKIEKRKKKGRKHKKHVLKHMTNNHIDYYISFFNFKTQKYKQAIHIHIHTHLHLSQEH
jgi:hypothetical protein